MLYLCLSWCTSRWHKQCLTPRKHRYWSTSRLRFQPLPDLFATATGSSILSLSCPPSTLALVVEYIAPAPAVYAPPAPVMVYLAQAQAVSYAAPAQYWSTSRLRFQPLPDLLRLQQGAQFSPCRAHRLHLHLWWSTSRRHQQFMLHLRLSWCTSRWHKQCLTPRKHKYWSTSRLRLQHELDLLQLQQEFHSLPLWWSTLRRHHNGMLHRACLNVHRANWDARAQFFDSVVIFPMSR